VAELLGIDPATPYTAEVADKVRRYLLDHWQDFGAARGAPALILWYTDESRTKGDAKAGEVPFCLRKDGTPAPTTFDPGGIGSALSGAITQAIAGLGDLAAHGAVLVAILAVLLLGLWYLFRGTR